MFKPFKVLSSDDPRISEQIQSEIGSEDSCWVLVETHPNDTVARIIAYDGGEPEDQTLARDYSWVPDILNEYYCNSSIELESLKKDLKNAISAAQKTAKNMEEMERDLYLKLNDKETEIEDYRDLLHDCADHLESQFDPQDNIAMIEKIRNFLDKRFQQ